MTDKIDVAGLRTLVAKATPGPWEQLVADSPDLLAAMQEDAAKVEDRVAGLIFSRAEPGAHGRGVSIATMNARRATLERDLASAALIVAAVNALPALLEAAEAKAGLEAERDRYKRGLEEVCNPLMYFQRLADAEGARLSGMAHSLANDPYTLQRIARAALSENPQ